LGPLSARMKYDPFLEDMPAYKRLLTKDAGTVENM